MSSGRNLCHGLVDAAADLRRYANLIAEFGEPSVLAVACYEIAERIESLLPRVLAFEGETLPALLAGSDAS